MKKTNEPFDLVPAKNVITSKGEVRGKEIPDIDLGGKVYTVLDKNYKIIGVKCHEKDVEGLEKEKGKKVRKFGDWVFLA